MSAATVELVEPLIATEDHEPKAGGAGAGMDEGPEDGALHGVVKDAVAAAKTVQILARVGA